MPDDPDIWPLPAYEVGQPKHIHALGVASARYNMLEFALLCLMFDYCGMANETTQYLFANMSNSLRLQLLARCAEDREADAATKECVLHFVACFNICAENRNTLMHSQTKQSGDALLNFAKAARGDPSKTNTLNLRLEDIRKVADEINEAVEYGLRLHAYIMLRKHTGIIPAPFDVLFGALPDKPRKPDSLMKQGSPGRQGG